MTTVAVVIPAAGRSSRMGEPKLLLRFRGEPLLARAVRLATVIDPRPVVVLRPDDTAARILLAGGPAHPVAGPGPQRGVAGSIARGLEAVLGRAEETGKLSGALVLLPDMPYLDGPMLEVLVGSFHAAGGGAVVSARYGAVGAPPVVLPRALLPRLVGVTGELRHHLSLATGPVRFVDLPPHALTDVDTPDDRRRVMDGR